MAESNMYCSVALCAEGDKCVIFSLKAQFKERTQIMSFSVFSEFSFSYVTIVIL